MMLSILQKLRNLFGVPHDNVELVKAQYQVLSKQIPLLYFILTANTLAVSYTYSHFAPLWLSVYLPVGISLICVLRLIRWWRQNQEQVDHQEALKQLRRTNVLAPVLAMVFTAWGLSIYGYGDPYAQGQVALYMALTVIGCIFCLMHLRSAALSVTLLVNIPFILFFLTRGHDSLSAMAVNLALVCVAMIVILVGHYRDFATLVESRKSLIAKQAETQRLSDENFRIANLDSLTGLPNRRAFFALLDQHHYRAIEGGERFAVGIIDLDGFKPVNDTYGHSTGDKVLLEAGQRISRACGPDVRLSRLGGDEFALIVTGDIGDRQLAALGQKIGEAVRVPYPVGSSRASIASSIGFAAFPDRPIEPEALYERADYALYYAKRNMRGQTVLFSDEHEAEIKSHGVIEQALQTGNLENELSLVFQPIVDTKARRTLAFEALARWRSPTIGVVSPDRFIPVAERAGLISSMTQILLGKALAALRLWPDDVRLSFNLSAHDISSAENAVQIIALINRSGIDPRRLDFEITETSVAHDFQQAVAAIVAFKALGSGISLDDFGTGYSSLSHVHRLPLDKIKVDRSFVTDINTNAVSHNIVKSVAALCSDMGLVCIIEGVETEDQLATLTELGCGVVQGYYFSKPMPEDRVLGYLANENSGAALAQPIAVNAPA